MYIRMKIGLNHVIFGTYQIILFSSLELTAQKSIFNATVDMLYPISMRKMKWMLHTDSQRQWVH